MKYFTHKNFTICFSFLLLFIIVTIKCKLNQFIPPIAHVYLCFNWRRCFEKDHHGTEHQKCLLVRGQSSLRTSPLGLIHQTKNLACFLSSTTWQERPDQMMIQALPWPTERTGGAVYYYCRLKDSSPAELWMDCFTLESIWFIKLMWLFGLSSCLS